MKANSAMPNKLIPVAAILGSLCVLASVFFLPWVAFLKPQDSDQQITKFLSDAKIQAVLDRVPDLRATLGVQRLETPDDVRNLFTDEEMKKTFALIRDKQALTGWILWRDVPRIDESLGWAIGLSLVATLLVLIWSPVVLTARLGKEADYAAKILIGCAGLALSLTLWQVPRVDTFGLRDDFQIALVCLLTGSSVSWGIWIALIGLTLIIASQIALITFRKLEQENPANEWGADA